MSDDWRIYLCQMGDYPASIAVDIGVSEELDDVPPALAKVRLTYKAPSENGLPTQEEFEAVSALEDGLLEWLEGSSDDVFVGRLTTQGTRVFYAYTRRAESEWDAFVAQLASEHGYDLAYVIKDDPDHKAYWNDLYPTADDWRVIQDDAVIDNLRKHGDDGQTPRRIDHWTYFPSETLARPFIEWATADRFTFDAEYSGAGDDGKYCVRLHHVSPATPREVNSQTLALMRKASELGGDYDGWETQVLSAGERH